jgi:hypothetical protein
LFDFCRTDGPEKLLVNNAGVLIGLARPTFFYPAAPEHAGICLRESDDVLKANPGNRVPLAVAGFFALETGKPAAGSYGSPKLP